MHCSGHDSCVCVFVCETQNLSGDTCKPTNLTHANEMLFVVTCLQPKVTVDIYMHHSACLFAFLNLLCIAHELLCVFLSGLVNETPKPTNFTQIHETVCVVAFHQTRGVGGCTIATILNSSCCFTPHIALIRPQLLPCADLPDL